MRLEIVQVPATPAVHQLGAGLAPRVENVRVKRAQF